MENAKVLQLNSDAAEIRELIETRIQAIQVKNLDALLATYLPEVVTFNLAPPLQLKGVDRKGAQAWFDSYEGPIRSEIRDLSVTVGDDVAYCHCLTRTQGTLQGGKEADMWLRATLCLRRVKGQWRVAHEHLSEPFDMKSFKAVLDLKP